MPIDQPFPARFESKDVAQIHVVVPRAEIGTAMQAALRELSALLREQNIEPAGPWFAHHSRRPTDTFDFAVCFPVARPVEPSGRVAYARIAAVDVIRTIYRGPYEGLPQAWPEFMNWVQARNLATREDIFEVYTVGRQESLDSATWQTELNCPLVGDAPAELATEATQ